MPDKKIRNISNSRVAIPDVVDAPTIGTATDVGTSRAYNNGAATVAFTAAVKGGAATSYTATSTPGSFTASGTSSPLTVAGLQSATSYTFVVQGVNSSGTWPASSASNSITATTVPQAPTIGTFTDGGTGTTGTLSFTAGATGGSSITNYKVSTDNSTYTALSPAQTTSPLSLSGLSVGTATYYLKAVNANGDSSASSGVSGTVIQPTAFESIATVTATGGESSLTFSSIPGTYQHLQMRYIGMDNSGLTVTGALKIRLNSDSGANYTEHRLTGSGTNALASGATGRAELRMDYGVTQSGSTNIYAAGIMDIQDYASTTKYKTMRGFGGQDKNGAGFINLASGLWLNTNAVTSITVLPESFPFASGSTFALYGIKGA